MKKRLRIILISLLILLTILGLGTYLAVNVFLEDIVRNRLASYIQLQQNRVYDYEFSSVEVAVLTGTVEVNDLRLIPRESILDSLRKAGDPKKEYFDMALKQFRLTDLDVWRLLVDNEIDIGLISFDEPSVKVFSNRNENITPSNELTKDIIAPTLKYAYVDSLKLNNARFVIRDASEENKLISSFDTARFSIYSLKIDSQLIAEGTYAEYEKTVFFMNNFKYEAMPDYRFHLEYIYNDPDAKIVFLEGLEFSPRKDKYEYMAGQVHETDWFDIKLKQLQIHQADVAKFQADRSIYFEKMLVLKPVIELYRDKRLPDPPYKFKALPSRIVRDLPVDIYLKTLELQKGELRYLEWEEGATQPGVLTFDELEMKVENFTSDSVLWEDDDTLRITMSGQFMKEGKVSFEYRTSITDTNDIFYTRGKVTDMPFEVINPLSEHMAFVKFEEGFINEISFSMWGDNISSRGSLDIDYEGLRKLHIMRNTEQLSKRQQKKKKGKSVKKEREFLSLLANSVAPINHNPGLPNYYPGTISHERDQGKFLFNYMVKSILSGVLTCMVPRMADDFKEKKAVKKQEKKRAKKAKSGK